MSKLRHILLCIVLLVLSSYGVWGVFMRYALADPADKKHNTTQGFDEVASKYLRIRDELPDVRRLSYLNTTSSAQLRAASAEFGIVRWALSPIDVLPNATDSPVVLAKMPDEQAAKAAAQRLGLRVTRSLGDGLYLLQRPDHSPAPLNQPPEHPQKHSPEHHP